MVQWICPICDHPMKGRHYCAECRSFVKHPYMMNVDFYLNERHPAREGDCEYHHPSFMETAAPGQSQSKAPGQSGAPRQTRTSSQSGLGGKSWPMPNSRQGSQPPGHRGSSMNNRSGNGFGGRNNSNVGMIIAAVVVIIFLLNLLLPLMMFIL